MSEEEKKAITNLIDLVKFWKKNNFENSNDEIILNLINKQQKEIDYQKDLYEKLLNGYNERVKEIEKLEDKIKETMKEVNKR